MTYLFETYYKDKINLMQSVKVVAAYSAKYCQMFDAEIILPKDGFTRSSRVNGLLDKENNQAITETVEWLFQNSANEGLFKLFIGNELVDSSSTIFFDHHDNTESWVLNISEEQFIELQKVLKENSLPEDLFYESSKAICVKSKGIMGFLGFKKCYTPKEFENSNLSF